LRLGAQEVSTDRFVREYRAALKQLRAANKNLRLEGKYDVQITTTTRPATAGLNDRVPDEYEYAASGGIEKLVFFKPKPKPFGRAVVANGEHSFVLRREKPEPSYYLEFTDLGTPFTKMLTDFRAEVANAAYSAGWIDLSDAIESGLFSLVSIKEVQGDGGVYQRLDFEYKPREGKISRAAGWLLLDAKRYWVLRQYEIHEEFRTKGAKPLTARGRNEYSDGEGVPTLRQVDFEQLVEDEYKTTRRLVFRASSWRYEATPLKDFTLAAYGLGSPERPSPSARHTDREPYLAVGIAVVALAGALVVKRLAAGRARKSRST